MPSLYDRFDFRSTIPVFLGVLIVCWTSGAHCCAQTAVDHYGLAASYYSRAQFKEAVVEFQEIIDKYPGTEQAESCYFYLGESFVQLENYAGAFTAYENFLTKRPQHRFAVRAKFRMGEAAYRLGRLAQAAKILESFVRDHPNEKLLEFALPYLGQVRFDRNEPQLAQRTFERALRLYPHSQMSNKSRIGLAQSLERQGAHEEAARFYRFIQTQRNNPYFGEACFELGRIEYQANQMKLAEKDFRLAVEGFKSKPKREKSRFWLARTLMSQGGLTESLQIFERLANQELDATLMSMVLFDGAVAALKTSDDVRARRWLERLEHHYPDNDWAEQALQMRIDIAHRSGDDGQTQALAQQFAEKYSKSENLTHVLDLSGRFSYSEKDYAKTIEIFENLLTAESSKRDPYAEKNRSTWRYFKALGHIGLKEFADAERLFSKIDADSFDIKLESSLAIAHATTLVELERFEDSVQHFRKYLKHNPTSPQSENARKDFAVALVQINRWVEAAEIVAEIKSWTNSVLESVHFMAESANRAKQYSYAERWFKVLVQDGNPDDFIVRGLAGLAWTLTENGRTDEAADVFKRLLADYQDSPFASEAALARGKFFEDAHQYEQAADMFHRVFSSGVPTKDPRLVRVAELRCAYNLQKLGGRKNLEAASQVLSSVIDSGIGESIDEATYMLAWVFKDLGRPVDSMNCFVQISEQFNDSKYWVDASYRIVEEAVRQKEYHRAQDLIDRLVERDLTTAVHCRILYLQGQVSVANKAWQNVCDAMEQLISKTDDKILESKANYWLGESYYQLKKFENAQLILSRLNEDPNQLNSKMIPWIQLRNAQCLVQLEKWSEALKTAEDGIRKFQGFSADFEFDFVMGRSLGALGRLDEARSAYQRVVDSKRGGATETAAIAQWRIGEAYFHQEKHKEAIAAYYRVDSLFSYEHWRAAALIQAGKCQEHLGNWKHAVKLYQQLIQEFPKSEYFKDATERMQIAIRHAQSSVRTKKR